MLCAQGVQLAGRPEEGGAGCEGAPSALLDRVSGFLAQERARLRGGASARACTSGDRRNRKTLETLEDPEALNRKP